MVREGVKKEGLYDTLSKRGWLLLAYPVVLRIAHVELLIALGGAGFHL